MTYRERPSIVAGATAWTKVADGSTVAVLPDGGMDLIWDGRSILVAGPDTGPHPATLAAGSRCSAVRFGPGTGPAVLGVPAHALRDQRVPLADLWPRPLVARMEEDLAGADGQDAAAAVLEEEAAVRLRAAPPSPVLAHAARRLDQGLTVAELAAEVGLGERQLHRRSLDGFGYGPKLLGRILRLQRALDLARRGLPFATTAARAGYADQAHMARDVRALTGSTLGALAAPVARPTPPRRASR